MKKQFIQLLGISVFVISLTACSGNDEDKDSSSEKNPKKTEEVSTAEMSEVSLKSNGINASVAIPQYEGPMKSIMAHSVEHDEDSPYWKINIGTDEKMKYSVVVEDVSFAMEEDRDMLKEKIADVEGTIYNNDYITKEKDYVLFKRTIADVEDYGEDFHFIAIKEVDGSKFLIYSNPEYKFPQKKLADNMLASALSIQDL